MDPCQFLAEVLVNLVQKEIGFNSSPGERERTEARGSVSLKSRLCFDGIAAGAA